MPELLNTLFAHHGLKKTEARSAILDVLKIAKAPMSYEQIKGQMEQVMDKATFYRNVAKFEGATCKFNPHQVANFSL